MTSLLKKFWLNLMVRWGFRCPACHGRLVEVYGWDKIECEDCHETFKYSL